MTEHRFAPVHTAWLPVTVGVDPAPAVATALALAERVVLVGYVRVSDAADLSAAAVAARAVRRLLRAWSTTPRVRQRSRVIVALDPWGELSAAAQEARPVLLVLGWRADLDGLGIAPRVALDRPPCDIALVRGAIEGRPRAVLVPVRGGPYAELALRIGMALQPEQLVALQVRREVLDIDAPAAGLDRVLGQLSGVERHIEITDDAVGAIMAHAGHADVVVLGATADPTPDRPALGKVAQHLLEHHPGPVLVVRTRRPMPLPMVGAAGSQAISILVDRWFAENTYDAAEFADLDVLVALKRSRGVTISLALPALNEEETVGKVIRTIQDALQRTAPLLDEIVLIDSRSTDRTREIAAGLGVPVYVHQELLPELGARAGKGEALWKSLLVTRGDIVMWIDTDIVNIHPRFVYGVIGPLLVDPRVVLVKGFYRRPLKVDGQLQAGGGGRVTELMARPLINLLYPELSGVVQPLSGEYAGRREALEQLPFFSGYGVETGLLIDVFERFGLDSLAQVNLQERVHHNQSLEALSRMSFVIAQAVFHKLARRYGHPFLDEVNQSMKRIQYEGRRYRLVVTEAAERERPPMVEVPQYRARREPAGRP